MAGEQIIANEAIAKAVVWFTKAAIWAMTVATAEKTQNVV